jgi:hypothetical protein
LHTGSWIGSNFDILIGDEEENRAWDVLGETRTFLQTQIDAGRLNEDQLCGALREIYAAEGSDWFWWYGPDFSTDNDALFDELFRLHLKSVYTICGKVPPALLERPIMRGRAAPLYRLPKRSIHPAITGDLDSFYEWSDAGGYVAGSEQGAMYRADRFVKQIFFGADHETLYLRIDLRKWAAVSLEIRFEQPAGFSVVTPPLERIGQQVFKLTGPNGQSVARDTLAAREVVELAVAVKDLGLEGEVLVAFQVRLFEDGIELECYPETATFQFVLDGEDSALRNWIV